jgi:hypothetical protein
MKNLLGLLFVLMMGLSVGCSSSKGKVEASGGSTSFGRAGAGGAGGVPFKDWSVSTGGSDSGASGSGGSNPYFGDLFAHPYYDPNDPCSLAIPWVTGINTNIVAGDLVQYKDKVYKYGGGCDPLTWTQEACIPATTVEWCAKCWTVTDTVCPIIDVTMIPDVAKDAGTGAR